MNNTPRQPNNFSVNGNAVAATDFDNMSTEDLDKLINATGKVQVFAPKLPTPKKEVNLDQYLGSR